MTEDKSDFATVHAGMAQAGVGGAPNQRQKKALQLMHVLQL